MSQSIDKSGQWRIETPQRLVQFVRTLFGISAARAKTLIERGHFSIGGKVCTKAGLEMESGTTLEYCAQGPKSAGPFGVRKVYLDAHIVVVDKPSGLLSAPLEGHKDASALSAARRFCQKGGRGPKVLHRLDKTTSGLLAFGRGVEATRMLAEQLESRKMSRTYRAIIEGTPKRPSGIIESRLVTNTGRGKRGSLPNTFRVHNTETKLKPEEAGHGKWSATQYRIIWTRKGVSAVELKLITGRTHQIRIHMAELGTPVCGEPVYGRTRHKGRLALHAGELVLLHPRTREETRFESPWPESLGCFWQW